MTACMVVCGGLAIVGCAAPGTGPDFTTLDKIENGYRREVARFNKDPRAHLNRIKVRCDQLEQYMLVFVRRERTGMLIKSLGPAERIRAKFRVRPFSVHFHWVTDDSQYIEALYVENENDGRLLVRERRGLLGLPPGVLNLHVDDPIKWGRARSRITDFGLARMMTRTVKQIALADQHSKARLEHKGIVRVEETGVLAHCIEIGYPDAPGFNHAVQQLLINVATGLPAGTRLFRPDGSIDMMYLYADLDTNTRLTDQDFRLEQKTARRPSGSKRETPAQSKATGPLPEK